jgi:putative transposase
VFFVIDVSSRRVEIAGIHADPCETQMLQYARNMTDEQDGFLKGKRVLIHDRDPLYTKEFRETLGAAGVRSLKLPKRSPNLNAHASCCTSLAA